MLKLAFRNVFRHKARTGLTLGSISLGVAAIILTGGFVEDIFLQLREATIHSQLGHLQVQKKGYAELGRRNPFDYLIENAEETSEVFKDLPGVSDVMMRVDFFGLATTNSGSLPIIGEGLQPDKEARLGTFLTITSGRHLTASDDFGISVGEGVARALKLEAGDYLTLLVNTADGTLNSQEFVVVGIFRSFSRDYDNRAVRISLQDAWELLAVGGAHRLVFSLQDTEETNSVAKLVRDRLATDMYETRAWYELADFYEKTVDLYRRQFGVLQIIILVMVFLSVANSVNMAIRERIGEFGTLMAMGDKGASIFRLIMTENSLLGLLGAACGIVAGVTIAWTITKFGIPMPPPPNSSSGYTAYVRIVPSVMIIAFVIGVMATILSAVLPAWRASRVRLIDALRENI